MRLRVIAKAAHLMKKRMRTYIYYLQTFESLFKKSNCKYSLKLLQIPFHSNYLIYGISSIGSIGSSQAQAIDPSEKREF